MGVHHAVAVLVRGGGDLGSVGDPHDECATGKRAVIDPDHEAVVG